MKSRVPLQVDPIFREKLKEIQQKFKDNGFEKSLRDITGDMVKLNVFNDFEKNIKNIKMDIRIRLDKR